MSSKWLRASSYCGEESGPSVPRKTLYIHKDSHFSDSNTRTFWNILSQNFSVSESHNYGL